MTFHDLKWPWQHDKGSLVTIVWLRVSILHVTHHLSVSNGFCPKEAPFIFLPLVYNRGRRIDLTLGRRYPTYKTCFIDTVTDNNHCKLQGYRSFGVAMTSIQAFSEVRSLDMTWWPDLKWPGSEVSQNVGKRCMNRCAKNGDAEH